MYLFRVARDCYSLLCLWPPAGRGRRFVAPPVVKTDRQWAENVVRGEKWRPAENFTNILCACCCLFFFYLKFICCWDKMPPYARQLVSAIFEQFTKTAEMELCQSLRLSQPEVSRCHLLTEDYWSCCSESLPHPRRPKQKLTILQQNPRRKKSHHMMKLLVDVSLKFRKSFHFEL